MITSSVSLLVRSWAMPVVANGRALPFLLVTPQPISDPNKPLGRNLTSHLLPLSCWHTSPKLGLNQGKYRFIFYTAAFFSSYSHTASSFQQVKLPEFSGTEITSIVQDVPPECYGGQLTLTVINRALAKMSHLLLLTLIAMSFEA